MKITKFNNSSICFNYKTYSNFEDYEYNNIYLIKNKNTYLTTYNFINFNEEYKYLFYKEANDKIIYDYLYRCLNKKSNDKYHPILVNLFK